MNERQLSAIHNALIALLFLLFVSFSFVGCFFTTGVSNDVALPHLTVKGALSDISALSLTVTGPGMNPVVSYFSPIPESISVEVPAGSDRRFELTAYPSSTSVGAALSFKGSATADLVAGESEDVTVEMCVYETKLVIPDLGGDFPTTGRLVQIDDPSGKGWRALTGSEVGWAIDVFRPYDVDFDSRGRIYVANYSTDAGYRRAFRVDDITGKNFTLFPDQGVSIVAVAVDRRSDYLYYASDSTLWRVGLDGANDKTLDTTDIGLIRGMTVDEKGLLYIAGNNNLGLPAVFRYDPVAQSVTKSYTTDIDTAWDTFVRSSYVYVANLAGGAGKKILQLDKDLSFIDGYGSQSPSADSVAGNFYGPKRFLGILPRKLVVLDESSTNGGTFQGDRLVSIEDLNGTGWKTYGQTGSGVGQFQFYWAC